MKRRKSSYTQMMTEIKADWSPETHALSAKADSYFAAQLADLKQKLTEPLPDTSPTDCGCPVVEIGPDKTCDYCDCAAEYASPWADGAKWCMACKFEICYDCEDKRNGKDVRQGP